MTYFIVLILFFSSSIFSQSLPFNDTFSDGDFSDWTFYKYSTGLHGDVPDPYIQNDRLFITTRDQQSTYFSNGSMSWTDYSVEFEAKIEQSMDDGYNGINVMFNIANIQETTSGVKLDGYVLSFEGRNNTWAFYRQYSDGTSGETLGSGSTTVDVGTNYKIKVIPI